MCPLSCQLSCRVSTQLSAQLQLLSSAVGITLLAQMHFAISKNNCEDNTILCKAFSLMCCPAEETGQVHLVHEMTRGA